jgi:hypothetical protein
MNRDIQDDYPDPRGFPKLIFSPPHKLETRVVIGAIAEFVLKRFGELSS